MAISKTGPKSLISAEQRLRALELRKAGLNYAQIARGLNISRTTAWRIVRLELARLVERRTEAAEHLRALQTQRFEAMVAKLSPKAMAQEPDLESMKLMLNVMQQEGKLWEIESPTKVEHNLAVIDDAATKVGLVALKFLPEDKREPFIRELRRVIASATKRAEHEVVATVRSMSSEAPSGQALLTSDPGQD